MRHKKKKHDVARMVMVPKRKEIPWTTVPDEASCRLIHAFFVADETIVDNVSTNFLKTVSLCRVCLYKYVLPFQPLHPLKLRLFHVRVGLPMEALKDTSGRFIQESLHDHVDVVLAFQLILC